MAPPRRILRDQCEILLDFLEANQECAKGLTAGNMGLHKHLKQSWIAISKKLNAVQNGAYKTPDCWRKYWIEWRYCVRKKAANSRRFESNSSRFLPLNDLEIRVLELSQKNFVRAPKSPKQEQNYNENDPEEQNAPSDDNKIQPSNVTVHVKRLEAHRSSSDDDNRLSPPPKWALQIEERRVAAEERIAEALESAVCIMRSQEATQAVMVERLLDAVTAITGAAQHMKTGMQEIVNHLHRIKPPHSNGEDVDIFLTE